MSVPSQSAKINLSAVASATAVASSRLTNWHGRSSSHAPLCSSIDSCNEQTEALFKKRLRSEPGTRALGSTEATTMCSVELSLIHHAKSCTLQSPPSMRLEIFKLVRTAGCPPAVALNSVQSTGVFLSCLLSPLIFVHPALWLFVASDQFTLANVNAVTTALSFALSCALSCAQRAQAG